MEAREGGKKGAWGGGGGGSKEGDSTVEAAHEEGQHVPDRTSIDHDLRPCDPRGKNEC